jgi:hypothetical protein
MGVLSDLIGKIADQTKPDAVVLGVKVTRYLRDELQVIGKDGPELSILGVPVLTNPLIPDHDVHFVHSGR